MSEMTWTLARIEKPPVGLARKHALRSSVLSGVSSVAYAVALGEKMSVFVPNYHVQRIARLVALLTFLVFLAVGKPALAVTRYADEGMAKAACEEDRAVTLTVKPNALLNSPGRDCSVKDPDWNYFGCFYFYGFESWQCGNVGPNNPTYDWQYSFPRGSTCSVRPSVTSLMPSDGAPQCKDGCEYSFSPNGDGMAIAAPTGNTCTPITKFDPGKNNECCGPTGPLTVGNPINAFVGNKTEVAVDFADPAGHLGLTRHYVSKEIPLNRGTVLGTRWRHNFQLAVVADYGHYRLKRTSGNYYAFRAVGANSWSPDSDVAERLSPIMSGSQVVGWRVTRPDTAAEIYAADGRLTSIEYADGDVVQVFYNASGQIDRVADRSQRSLVFAYSSGLLDSVTLPDGSVRRYSFDAYQNLATVTYQPSQGAPTLGSVQYLYEDANDTKLLTGITDESGQRYATWQYDLQGRAVSSRHGMDADWVLVSYGLNGSTVTGSLGESVALGYQVGFGRAKLNSAQKLCPNCSGASFQSRSYDGNGYTDQSTGFDGVTTNYDFDARGLLFQRIDAANDASAKRTTQTDWHATLAVPLERRTYDAAGALVRKEVWTYNSRGQVVTHAVNEL